MKNSFLRFSVVLLITAFGFFSSAQNKKFDLKYNIKPQTKFRLTNLHISSGTNVLEEPFKQTFYRTRELILDYNVLNPKDNNTVFEVKYVKKLYKTTDDKGETHINNFEGLKGNKIQYSLSEKGQFGNFIGMEKLPNVNMSGNWTYTARHYQEELEHMFPFLPAEPVSIGDTWTKKMFGMTIEYRLMGEIQLHGYDCVRIYAMITDDIIKRKVNTREGKTVELENDNPYSDIYYFAYKEGIILYRFSVCSNGKLLVSDMEEKVLRKEVRRTLYETHIQFK